MPFPSAHRSETVALILLVHVTACSRHVVSLDGSDPASEWADEGREVSANRPDVEGPTGISGDQQSNVRGDGEPIPNVPPRDSTPAPGPGNTEVPPLLPAPDDLLSDPLAAEALGAHAAFRSAFEIHPPLPALAWSSALADWAQAWADTLAAECGPTVRKRPDNPFGENVYFERSSPFFPDTEFEEAVPSWGSEGECWGFGTKYVASGDSEVETCNLECAEDIDAANDGTCDRFTQLIWRNTTSVGCGQSACTSLENGREWNSRILVCNYDPPGNVAGETPY